MISVMLTKTWRHVHHSACSFLSLPSPCLPLTSFAGDSGTLTLKGHVSTRGLVPRNFKLCGDACQWLVVGNQESKSVCSFRIDADTGMPVWVSEVSTGDAKPCNIAPMPV